MIEVPLRQPDLLWHEVALAISSMLFVGTWHPFGFIVAINGILCHGSAALSLPSDVWFMAWDVSSSILMCAYVNLHLCAQPMCINLTCFAIVAFLYEMEIVNKVTRAVVHMLFVQFPLLAALHHFARACGPDDNILVLGDTVG
tara:strand:- start:256 stop:684 length:429 start_codon:yes stop_codon:yes gene_type:complete